MIAALIKEGIGFWFKSRKAKKAAEHDRYIEEVKAGLHDPNKLRYLKWVSFVLFTSPLVMVYWKPGAVATFIANLALFPDWYIKVYLAITGSIWGISVGKDVLGSAIKQISGLWINHKNGNGRRKTSRR